MSDLTTPRISNSPLVTRRNFIQLGLAALGAAWAGLFIQSRLFPAATTARAQTVNIPLNELPVGGSKAFLYGGAPAIVLRTPESIRAFSLVCTHLGCTVQWQPEKGAFYCPCHDGRFDQFGEVTSGPPPVPLEALAVTVENDTVIIGEG
jgi:cytochrome b6-f complex iron-sulfur subunit